MTKRNKIIVSIVGITIVLLALLGITYAYYLTRIEGNTNTNSISITTADLKLVYGDGNGLVSKENIMPGTTIEKTFTVTNSGNNKVDLYAVYLEELTNTLSRTEDLTYVLTCESTGEDCDGNDGEFPTLAGMIVTNSIDTGVTHTYTLTVTYKNEENIDQSIDMGSTISAFVQIYALKDIVDIEGSVNGTEDGDFAQINSVQKRSQIVDGKYKFAGVLPGTHTIKICSKSDANCTSPKLTKQIIINLGNAAGVDGNKITITNDSQTATININLTETIESNKVIIGTEIKDHVSNNNPFSKGTLAYTIVNNAKKPKDSNSTIFSETPLTPLNTTGGAGENERILSLAEDDYTETTRNMSYYFRGNVKDNYVTFNNMCWRVVRIQGDGSVKLILSNFNAPCSDTNNDGKLDDFIDGGEYNSSWIANDSYYFNANGFLNKSSLVLYYHVYDQDYIDTYGEPETLSVQLNYTPFLEENLSKIKKEYYTSYYEKIGYIYDGIHYDSDPCSEEYEWFCVEADTYVKHRIFEKKEYTLKSGKEYLSNIGTLLVDEIIYGGNKNSYLENESSISNIVLNDEAYTQYNYPFYFGGDLTFKFFTEEDFIDYSMYGSRPVITLVNTVTATGDGTINNPYVIQ